MKVRIPQAYRTVLLQQPVSTPLLVGLENPTETALALRVTDLFSLRRQRRSITVWPIGYQGKEGPWLVAIAFCVGNDPAAPLEDAAYMNPRQADDHRLLQHLATQERLPFLFLSPRLTVAAGHGAPWSVQHRQEVRMLLARIEHSLPGEELTGSVDPDFERVKQEFQGLDAIKTLLTLHTHSDVRLSAPFRGVVLD